MPLIIDPELAWSTYLGGTAYQGVLAVESDHHKDHQDEDQLVARSIVYLKSLVTEIRKERER